jgi:hypothetical protein
VSRHGGGEVDSGRAQSGSYDDFEREDLADLDDGAAVTSNGDSVMLTKPVEPGAKPVAWNRVAAKAVPLVIWWSFLASK